MTPLVRRGLARGQRRGKYAKRARVSVRHRICDCARTGGEWQLVALSNEVKVETARNWILKLMVVGGSYR